MNIHPDFRAYFEDIAKKLLLLSREPGKANLIFTEGPDGGNVLLNAIKEKVSYPFLMVEFEDVDSEGLESKTQVLHSAFVVMDSAKKRSSGVGDIEWAIYQRSKPAADQILAKMKRDSELLKLKIAGKPAMLVGANAGNWVGPLANDVYGWRIEFTLRISGGTCLDPFVWDQGV